MPCVFLVQQMRKMKKSIIITGADGNLGKTVTRYLLNQGYSVFASISPNGNPQFMHSEDLHTETVDLLNAELTAAWINRVVQAEGERLSGVICLAGGFAMGGLTETGREEINRMLDLNFFTAWNVVQPILRVSSSTSHTLPLVLIASRAAIEPAEGKHIVGYSMSKSLLLRLAEFINADTHTTGINASVILPSTLDTEATRDAMPDADHNKWVPTQSVAETIQFILSDAGSMLRNPIFRLYNKA
jgi:NAD(P)-dependent dehydrogenase (short-subunit alcohol dehydrogenase family)